MTDVATIAPFMRTLPTARRKRARRFYASMAMVLRQSSRRIPGGDRDERRAAKVRLAGFDTRMLPVR